MTEKYVDIPYSEMDILDALKLIEQGTDDPEDNEIINRAIAEITALREKITEIAIAGWLKGETPEDRRR